MRQRGTCHYCIYWCSTLHTVDLFNSTWTLACCESFGQRPTNMTMETYYEHTHVHNLRNIYISIYLDFINTLMFNRKRRNTSTTSLFSIVIAFSPPESNCSWKEVPSKKDQFQKPTSAFTGSFRKIQSLSRSAFKTAEFHAGFGRMWIFWVLGRIVSMWEVSWRFQKFLEKYDKCLGENGDNGDGWYWWQWW